LKSISIHQPNYFPWLGYFFKAALADVFIFHDDIKINMRGYTRRTQYEDQVKQVQLLTVPMATSEKHFIVDSKVNDEIDWRQNHLDILKNAYSHTKHFKENFDLVSHLLMSTIDQNKIADINIYILTNLFDLLEIHPKIYRSSDLAISEKGSQYNLKLATCFDAKKYYSGMGAKQYQDEESFARSGIKLQYVPSYKYLEKNMYRPMFKNGLSILDILFYCGLNQTKKYIQRFVTNSSFL